jgi:hypothetical protein
MIYFSLFWVNISVGAYGSAWDCFMIFVETQKKEVDAQFSKHQGQMSRYLRL